MDDDELVRLVAARVPELSELEIDKLASALAGKTITLIDGEVAERLTTVIAAMENRVAEMSAVLVSQALAQEAQEWENAFVDSAAEVFH
jgi:hypothetical protein